MSESRWTGLLDVTLERVSRRGARLLGEGPERCRLRVFRIGHVLGGRVNGVERIALSHAYMEVCMLVEVGPPGKRVPASGGAQGASGLKR